MLVRTGEYKRAWEPLSEADPARGGVSPRARRTSHEGGVSQGALCCATFVGRGGHHGVGRVVHVS
jgi:hypothetical protein